MARLRRNTKILKGKALDALSLAIELFNRPSDVGRTEAVLIHVHHAHEMLLKAAVWEKRGSISAPGSRITFTFEKCVSIAKSDLAILDQEAANTLFMLDGLRNCAYHNHLALTEDALYLMLQAGVTLFEDHLHTAFGESLSRHLPTRVLPVSTKPPTDIMAFFDGEFESVARLLLPGRRQSAVVAARLRPFFIMESALQGPSEQPSVSEVRKAVRQIGKGENWRSVFPGVATLRLDNSGAGLSYSLRFTRDTNKPAVRVLKEGEEAAEGVTLVREVNLLDRYPMGARQLAARLKISEPKMRALATSIDIYSDTDCFRVISVGSQPYRRYSIKALDKLGAALGTSDLDQIWEQYKSENPAGGRRRRTQATRVR